MSGGEPVGTSCASSRTRSKKGERLRRWTRKGGIESPWFWLGRSDGDSNGAHRPGSAVSAWSLGRMPSAHREASGSITSADSPSLPLTMKVVAPIESASDFFYLANFNTLLKLKYSTPSKTKRITIKQHTGNKCTASCFPKVKPMALTTKKTTKHITHPAELILFSSLFPRQTLHFCLFDSLSRRDIPSSQWEVSRKENYSH